MLTENLIHGPGDGTGLAKPDFSALYAHNWVSDWLFTSAHVQDKTAETHYSLCHVYKKVMNFKHIAAVSVTYDYVNTHFLKKKKEEQVDCWLAG